MPTIGIKISGRGIGDNVQFSSFPENVFRNTGEKVVDLENSWVFDYNPYVLRGVSADVELDLWFLGVLGVPVERRLNPGKGPIIFSLAERTCDFTHLKCFLRHPRLYRFEDLPIVPNRIAFHSTGKTVGPMPDSVIAAVQKNYENFEIVQVGPV